jgi:hypothetical protein
LLNTSFPVGGALFLAVVTAGEAGSGSAQAAFGSFRPGLALSRRRHSECATTSDVS